MAKDNADINYIEGSEKLNLRSANKENVISPLSNEVCVKKGSENVGNTSAVRSKDSGINSPYSPDTKGQNSDTVSPYSSEIYNKLKESVIKGKRAGITDLIKSALDDDTNMNVSEKSKDILNNVLIPAIGEVGALFDKGRYFLPQLIAGANAMKDAVEYLEPYLATGAAGADMPVVIIATVEGDIHDIGKNLVALMLKNHGFKVIDLGKDVSKEVIIESAIEHGASLIALSALMTTTMRKMKDVIDYKNECCPDVKVAVGGAVITPDYADSIGADAYSKDASETVRVIRELLRGKVL